MKKVDKGRRQDRSDVAVRRERWRDRQRFMGSFAFVLLDETGASTNVIRRYGWGPQGERLVDAAPHGHWLTTFVGGLRTISVIAPLVLDGPMTGCEATLAKNCPDLPICQRDASFEMNAASSSTSSSGLTRPPSASTVTVPFQPRSCAAVVPAAISRCSA